MREHVSPEGDGEEPAQLGLTVRDAILAAAELISDVPIPRAGRGESVREVAEEVRGHG